MTPRSSLRHDLVIEGGPRAAQTLLVGEGLDGALYGFEDARDRTFDGPGAPVAWANAAVFWRSRLIPEEAGFVRVNCPAVGQSAAFRAISPAPASPLHLTRAELPENAAVRLEALGVTFPLQAALDIYRSLHYGTVRTSGPAGRCAFRIALLVRGITDAGLPRASVHYGRAQITLSLLRGDPTPMQELFDRLRARPGTEVGRLDEYLDAIRDLDQAGL